MAAEAAGQAGASITVTGTEDWYESGGLRIAKRQAPMGFPMAHSDWNRFGDYLEDLGTALPPIHDRYIRFEGMAVGGGIGFLGWLVVIATGTPINPLLATIGLILLAGTLAASGIAWSNRGTEQFLEAKIKRDSKLLYDDMNRTHSFGHDAD